MAAKSLQEGKNLLPFFRYLQLTGTSMFKNIRFFSSSTSSGSTIAPKGPQSVEKSQPQAKDIIRETPKPSSVVTDEVYKNQQYFNYNTDSFADLEIEIDNIGSRQTQPDPKMYYKHSDPWKK